MYRSPSASATRPMSRNARSGTVLTLTSLKGPFGGVSAIVMSFSCSVVQLFNCSLVKVRVDMELALNRIVE